MNTLVKKSFGSNHEDEDEN